MTSHPGAVSWDPDRARRMYWRVGRKVGRTIYAQVNAEPSNEDRLIGVMDTPALARVAVEAHNGPARQQGRTRHRVNRPVTILGGPRDGEIIEWVGTVLVTQVLQPISATYASEVLPQYPGDKSWREEFYRAQQDDDGRWWYVRESPR